MNGHRKRTGLTASGIAAALSCVLFFSCNNEDYLTTQDPEKACDNICFGVSPDESVRTRGGDNGKEKEYTSDRFVLRSQDSADTLCVRAIVSEGISTAESDTRKVITRGAPLTEDNFDKFHVLAYWKKGDSSVDRFYMNEDATKNGDIWRTDRTYYWPGATHSFQFYAWAPVDAEFTSTPTSPTETTLTYTVPANAADQKDIVVATTNEISGDNDAAVPLTFRHICTAVRFSVGSEMQPGTIKSVALKGIRDTGTYDMKTGKWSNVTGTTTFTQVLDKTTTGGETEGTAITDEVGIFMMLPGTLQPGAEVEVVFVDEKGDEHTYNASIAGTDWPMGKTINYKISISPEYELEFLSTSEAQDAHYVIYPITIKADENVHGGWKLTSNDPENVTFVETRKIIDGNPHEDIENLIKAGYWLTNDYHSNTTLISTTTGEVLVYVFLRENVTEFDREITLSLMPGDGQHDDEARTFTFKQYCPAWNGNIGVERIQDQDYPWGFNWSTDMKVTYNMGKGIGPVLVSLYLKLFDRRDYIIQEGYGIITDYKVTIDFSKVARLNTATSSDNGLTNTWQLYTFDGINDASSLMENLKNWGGQPDHDLPHNPTEFAARACAMKNIYRVEVSTEAGNTVYRPVLDQANMVWYLPSQDEAPSMNDNLSGDYWTSTAITEPGTTAYKYTAGGITSPHDRNEKIHVRAVRKQP